MYVRNANWSAVADKAKGDTIKLVRQATRYSDSDEPDQIIDGTITKATSATRSYTALGATREGYVRLGAHQRNATEQRGYAIIGDGRYEFRIATEQDIERLTDPNRGLRETLASALQDLRYARPITRADLATLLTDIRAVQEAAIELDAALANVSG